MEALKRFFESNRQKDICPDSRPSQRDTKKPRRLIVKDPRHKLRVRDGYLEIYTDEGEFLAGFAQFDALYLHKEIAIDISDMYELSRHMRVYLIDMHGNLLGRFKRYRLDTK